MAEQQTEKDVNYQNTIQMLQYFQDEYKYRHENFWKLLKMFFVLNIAVSLLPIISGILGLEIKIERLPTYIFPIVGMLIACFSFYILKNEAKSFSLVAKKKYEISELLPIPYQYKKSINVNHKRKTAMPIKLSFINLCFQISVSVISLIICILV